MDKGDNMLDHINKVKFLKDQFTCLDVPKEQEDVVMTLFDCLTFTFDYLIIALEMCPILELKEKEPQGHDAAMLSRQS